MAFGITNSLILDVQYFLVKLIGDLSVKGLAAILMQQCQLSKTSVMDLPDIDVSESVFKAKPLSEYSSEFINQIGLDDNTQVVALKNVVDMVWIYRVFFFQHSIGIFD